MRNCLGMSKKMKEEGPMDNKKCFYDETVLAGKVKAQIRLRIPARSNSVVVFGFPGCRNTERDLLNANSHKAVIAMTHRCQRVGMAKV